jgi:hypothetical protein
VAAFPLHKYQVSAGGRGALSFNNPSKKLMSDCLLGAKTQASSMTWCPGMFELREKDRGNRLRKGVCTVIVVVLLLSHTKSGCFSLISRGGCVPGELAFLLRMSEVRGEARLGTG